MDLVPLLFIIIPIFGLLLAYISRRYAALSILSSLANLLLAVYLYRILSRVETIRTTFSFSVFPLGINFKIDMLSYIFVTLVSLVWLLITIYTKSYIKPGEKIPRYHTFLMLTFAGLMGVFVSGDFLSLFFFFELMTITSYILVVHRESEEARSGGSYYLFMGISGGLLILWGIVLLYKITGSVLIEPLGDQSSYLGYLIPVLLILGFGVKAGMFPVHIWLPKAHPVAPSPASALLSGIIIKAGAYGILRVLTLYWSVIVHDILQNLGIILIWIGSITMMLGVVYALFQKNIKKMLAYHSISQMGYILTGFGIAGYLHLEGVIGFTGGIYHIINHALFKSNLFLIAGIICLVTGKVNLKYIGGLGKRYPLLFIAFLISALGISGIPGFNGYVSKTLIHHGLLEAYHFQMNNWLLLAEKIFVITSMGTFISFLKMGYYAFVRKLPDHLLSENNISELKPAIPPLMKFVILTFSVLIVLLGVFPGLLINNIFKPLYLNFGFNQELIAELSIWNQGNLLNTLVYLTIGGLFFLIAIRYSWFDYQIPVWFFPDKDLQDLKEVIAVRYYKASGKFGLFKSRLILLPGFINNVLIKFDSFTIKNIQFTKMIVAGMLVIVLVSFFLFQV